MNTFLLWLWNKIVSAVNALLNPKAAEQAKALDKKADQAHGEVHSAVEHEKQSEAQDEQSAIDRANLENQRQDLEQQIKTSEAERAASRTREDQIDAEAKIRDAAVDARSDDERFSGVPK